MGKYIAVLTVLLLALQCAVGVGAAGITAIEDRPTVEALMGAVTVDGEIEEAWNSANTIALEGVFEGEKQDGVDYASCNVSILWNGVNELYLLYEVVDPMICAASTEAYRCDTAEWYFDFNNFNDENTAVDMAWHAYPEESFSGMDYVFESKVTDDGYVVEALIYLDTRSVTLTVGDYIGADFQINEDANDDGERDIAIRWSSWRSDFWQDCSEYGQVLLSAETIPGFTPPATESSSETVDTSAPDTSSSEPESSSVPESSSQESTSAPDSSSDSESSSAPVTTDGEEKGDSNSSTWLPIVLVIVAVVVVAAVVLAVLRKKRK